LTGKKQTTGQETGQERRKDGEGVKGGPAYRALGKISQALRRDASDQGRNGDGDRELHFRRQVVLLAGEDEG
jgi:hypothetical protein